LQKSPVRDFLSAVYQYGISVKFRILIRFMNEELESKLIVRELEKLCKSKTNSLSETSVAIVASSLNVSTTAKRKRAATSKKKKSKTKKKIKKVK